MRKRTRARLSCVSGGVLLIALALAGTAHASSLVFVKDGNVWLANPDGSGQYQVTLDGSAGDPYKSPSQADDGTIVAARGSGPATQLYRMAQNGTLLNPPVGTAAPATGPVEPVVSPDGTKVAFHYVFCDGSPCSSKKNVLYTYSNRLTDPSVFGQQQSDHDPSWVGNNRALLFFGTRAEYDDLGGGDNSQTSWFYDTDFPGNGTGKNLQEGEISAQGDKLAVVRTDGPGDAGQTIRIYTLNGPPAPHPNNAPTEQCDFTGPVGDYADPSWSPDGGSLAWAESNGVWTSGVVIGPPCGSPGAGVRIAGATEPDWGPANVNPGPRSTGVTPRVTGLRLGSSRFRAALRGGSIASPVGTRVKYALSEPATTTFNVERALPGRKLGRRCVAPNRRNQRAPRCTRYSRVRGSFRRKGGAGANNFRFTGRLGGRALRPGKYRLVAVAKDAAGHRSQPARASFRIVRR
jgi:Tol biopolymer transport system component